MNNMPEDLWILLEEIIRDGRLRNDPRSTARKINELIAQCSTKVINDIDEFILRAELLIYNQVVKYWESEAYFSKVAPALLRLSSLVSESIAARVTSLTRSTKISGARHIDATFVVHTASTLAHIDLAITVLERYQREGGRKRFLFICLFGVSIEMKERLLAAGATVIFLDQLGCVNKTRERLALAIVIISAVKSRAVVQLSVPVHLGAIFGAIRIALPDVARVHLALKYKTLRSTLITRYACAIGAEASRQFDGQYFHNIPFIPDFKPRSEVLRNEIRSKLNGQDFLAGVIGREEKLADTSFLACVSEILNSDNRIKFFYTANKSGKSRVSSSLNPLLLCPENATPIGWVDPHHWCSSLDIFLDSFPFPCGYTAVQALACNVPVVTLNTPENNQTGLLCGLDESFGKSEFVANSPEEYVDISKRIIQKGVCVQPIYYFNRSRDNILLRFTTTVVERALGLE